MTTFAGLLHLTGLNHAEAAEYISKEVGYEVSTRTIRDTAQSTSVASEPLWIVLAKLHDDIEHAAANLAATLTDDDLDHAEDLRPGNRFWPSSRSADLVVARAVTIVLLREE